MPQQTDEEEQVQSPEEEYIGKLEFYVSQVKKYFREYAQHKRHCRWYNPNGQCNCGLDNAVSAIEKGQPT
jgi:hypothetical protein